MASLPPTPTTRRSGHLYLLGSTYGSLVIQPRSDPVTVSGPPRSIGARTQPWEEVVIEAPSARWHDGQLWLLYTCGGYDKADYAVGALRFLGGDPRDPAAWKKLPGPLFTQFPAAHVWCAGAAAAFTSPDGQEDWFAYSGYLAYNAPKDLVTGPRTIMAERLNWRADGTPDFGQPVAPDQSPPLPSGDPASCKSGQKFHEPRAANGFPSGESLHGCASAWKLRYAGSMRLPTSAPVHRHGSVFVAGHLLARPPGHPLFGGGRCARRRRSSHHRVAAISRALRGPHPTRGTRLRRPRPPANRRRSRRQPRAQIARSLRLRLHGGKATRSRRPLVGGMARTHQNPRPPARRRRVGSGTRTPVPPRGLRLCSLPCPRTGSGLRRASAERLFREPRHQPLRPARRRCGLRRSTSASRNPRPVPTRRCPLPHLRRPPT